MPSADADKRSISRAFSAKWVTTSVCPRIIYASDIFHVRGRVRLRHIAESQNEKQTIQFCMLTHSRLIGRVRTGLACARTHARRQAGRQVGTR